MDCANTTSIAATKLKTLTSLFGVIPVEFALRNTGLMSLFKNNLFFFNPLQVELLGALMIIGSKACTGCQRLSAPTFLLVSKCTLVVTVDAGIELDLLVSLFQS
jgi:hypothetical protein